MLLDMSYDLLNCSISGPVFDCYSKSEIAKRIGAAVMCNVHVELIRRVRLGSGMTG